MILHPQVFFLNDMDSYPSEKCCPTLNHLRIGLSRKGDLQKPKEKNTEIEAKEKQVVESSTFKEIAPSRTTLFKHRQNVYSSLELNIKATICPGTTFAFGFVKVALLSWNPNWFQAVYKEP